MQTQMTKWGNSLGVRIPKTFADRAGLHEGTPIEISIQDHTIVIKKSYSLEALLSQITPDNLHKEVLQDKSRGKEEW